MSSSTTGGPSIAGRMDRLPLIGTHRKATTAVGLGLFFDMYEIFLTPVLSTALVQEFQLSTAELPLVLASTFLGMFVGTLLLGRLADRIGRRRAFLLSLAVYSLFSLLGAFSTGPWMLAATRFVAGVGIGAEPPLADAYLSDLLPAKRRGRYIAWAYTVAFLGVPAAGFLAHWLVPAAPLGIAGWRWMFALGALGAVVVFLLRRGLPESPRWLAATGRQAEAEALVDEFEAQARATGAALPEPEPARTAPRPAGGLRDLVAAPYGKRTAMMAAFQVLQTVGYYGFGTMVPLVLAAKSYEITDTLLFSAVTYLGYPAGAALSLPFVERMERKHLVIASALGMMVLGLAFGLSASTVPIVAFGFLYTAVSNVFSNAFHIYQAEIFPTHIRATAASWTYSLSRLTTGAMPFVLVPLLHAQGAGVLFAVVAAAMIGVGVDIGLFGPRSTGRPLEDVSER
ncbi:MULTISPECIES: MFS transporter [unclassified Saccharopolyspora]|uniref:MFS transporter n=1 Tax=unclassified Saccharopolyspora TaxID=2646250 RepID=UPI0027E01AF3|nr:MULTISPECIES: MFS transporter [unclassified Saccharopolyspora]